MRLFESLVKARRSIRIVSLIALVSLAVAAGFVCIPTAQVASYNQGVELYKQGNLNGAREAFETSLTAFNNASQRTSALAALLPSPSREVAALALSYEGEILMRQNHPQEALAAFDASLRMNPVLDPKSHLTTSDIKRMDAEVDAVQYDQEMLLALNPALGPHPTAAQGQIPPNAQ